MEHFSIRTITESNFDNAIEAVGGERAHPIADRRERPGADYLLNEAIIEFKALDEEGFDKAPRQAKLASLFREHIPDCPVVVLDPGQLPVSAQRHYDEIVQGPIRNCVRSARKQLKQSRAEFPKVTTSVLFLVNNGYTGLNHDDIVRFAANRARNDTDAIDGVVVAGCYFHSDAFDSYFLTPIQYVPIRVDRPFRSLARLEEAWKQCCESAITASMFSLERGPSTKGPVIDLQFEADGVTYVKPAPPIGNKSDFYVNGRPRDNSSGVVVHKALASTYPRLTADDWGRLRTLTGNDPSLHKSYLDWRSEFSAGVKLGTPLNPFVPVPVDVDDWLAWCKTSGTRPSGASIRQHANNLFNTKAHTILESAHEKSPNSLIPSRYVFVVTQQIGQNMANDLSSIFVVAEQVHGEPIVRNLVADARITHEHALALGSVHAVAEGISFVLYEKDLRYAWH